MVLTHRNAPRRYDAIVIGAGQAGVPLSRALAQAGWRTALVEKEHVGGTCINEGCTPSKTMIASARVAYLAGRAADYGVRTDAVSVDMNVVRQRKRDMVESWRSANEQRLSSTEGLDLIEGEAHFVAPHVVEVRLRDGSALFAEARHVFINTGCRPTMPDLPGLEDAPYLTSTTVMDLDASPEHLLILGGGYIAVEFAQMFRRFGSRVTIVQRHGNLLPREDPDVAQSLGAILREDGIRLLLEARALSVGPAPAGAIELEVESPEGAVTLAGSHLLVAVGRTPNTETLAPEAAGLEVDERGYLPVNERLETRVPGIYALGDVNGGPAFTHISYDDFRVIRTNLLEEGRRTTSDRLVPYVVFSDPQLGRVGLSEREARALDLDVKIFKMPTEYVARALEADETRGLMKVVVDVSSDRLLGCAILAIDGGELMALIEMAMLGGLTASDLKDAVFAHPTLAESLNNLFAS